MRIAGIGLRQFLFSHLLTSCIGALNCSCALNQVQASVLSQPGNVERISFQRTALLSRRVLRFFANDTVDLVQLALVVTTGDPLLADAHIALSPDSSLPYLAQLPLSVDVEKEDRLLGFFGIVRASLADLVRFQNRSQTVHGWHDQSAVYFLHVRSDSLGFHSLALRYRKRSVHIGTGCHSNELRVTIGQSVLFFFRYAYRCFRPMNISTERSCRNSHSASIHLHGFLLDVFVRFKTSVQPADLD